MIIYQSRINFDVSKANTNNIKNSSPLLLNGTFQSLPTRHGQDDLHTGKQGCKL